MGRGRPARRQAPLRRRDLHARPRRGLHAGRSGAADRQPQGRRAAAPAGGTQRTSAGRGQPPHVRADERARAGRGGGGARRDRIGRIEARPPVERPLDSSRSISSPWRSAAGSSRRSCSPRCAARARTRDLDRRRVGMGARLRHPRAGARSRVVSRVRPARARTGDICSPTAMRPAASHVDRHDRERARDRVQYLRGGSSAPWRRRSSRGSRPGAASSSPGRRSSSCACATCACAYVGRRTRAGDASLDGEPAAAVARARAPAPRAAGRGAARSVSRPGDGGVRPLLEIQRKWSAIPRADELLIERMKSRDGRHLFLYPLEGRLVHEGLAALFAYRMSRLVPITFALSSNDWGIELLSATSRRSPRRSRRGSSRRRI